MESFRPYSIRKDRRALLTSEALSLSVNLSIRHGQAPFPREDLERLRACLLLLEVLDGAPEGDATWLRARCDDTLRYVGDHQRDSFRVLASDVANFVEEFPGVLPRAALPSSLGIAFAPPVHFPKLQIRDLVRGPLELPSEEARKAAARRLREAGWFLGRKVSADGAVASSSHEGEDGDGTVRFLQEFGGLRFRTVDAMGYEREFFFGLDPEDAELGLPRSPVGGCLSAAIGESVMPVGGTEAGSGILRTPSGHFYLSDDEDAWYLGPSVEQAIARLLGPDRTYFRPSAICAVAGLGPYRDSTIRSLVADWLSRP